VGKRAVEPLREKVQRRDFNTALENPARAAGQAEEQLVFMTERERDPLRTYLALTFNSLRRSGVADAIIT
jgi:hypothetical protein